MTTQQLTNRLQAILLDTGVRPGAMTDQARFRQDLGLDSLDVVDMLIQVEVSFGIRIPDEDWWKLQTIGQLTDYLADELVIRSHSATRTGTLLPGDVYALSL